PGGPRQAPPAAPFPGPATSGGPARPAATQRSSRPGSFGTAGPTRTAGPAGGTTTRTAGTDTRRTGPTSRTAGSDTWTAGPTTGTASWAADATAGRTDPSAGTTYRPASFSWSGRAGWSPAPWPSTAERLIYAALAWVPLALLVAFGGGAVSGCAEASVGCPSFVPPLQAAALVLILIGLLAFPRAAYLATGAGVGMIVAGLGALFVSAAFGLLATSAADDPARSASSLVAAFVVTIMLIAYALAGLAVWRDHPLRRPWLVRLGGRSRPPAAVRGARR
ncbi:MAG: hypothetical protein ACRDGL_02300, partial [Candidatus Limnocylindrales bacterium]